MAVKSRLWLFKGEFNEKNLNFGSFKGEFKETIWENTNPGKVEKSQIWFIDIKQTNKFESKQGSFKWATTERGPSVSVSPSWEKILTRSRSRLV
jgi:hypothetical protein